MSEKTFSVPVEKIGTFVFRKRCFRDNFAVQAEYVRITEGVDNPGDNMAFLARSWAAIKVLLVEAPDGFDLEELDPYDDESYMKLVAVGAALSDKEASFRPGAAKNGAQSGSGNVADPGVPVSPPVQAAAD